MINDKPPQGDLISRQELLKKQYRIDDSATLSTRDVVNVEDIEDAQGIELQGDLISRQAVLDTEYQVKVINDIEYVMLSEVQMKVRKLPPAQPDIEAIRQEIINLTKTYPFMDHLDAYVKEEDVLKIIDKHIQKSQEHFTNVGKTSVTDKTQEVTGDRCGTCIYFNGDMLDDQNQFCDEKEVYVSKTNYCPRYKCDSEKIGIKDWFYRHTDALISSMSSEDINFKVGRENVCGGESE